MGSFNTLSKEKRNYKTLVTTTKLCTYDFYPRGMSLSKSSSRQGTTFSWVLEPPGTTQPTPFVKIAFIYPTCCLFFFAVLTCSICSLLSVVDPMVRYASDLGHPKQFGDPRGSGSSLPNQPRPLMARLAQLALTRHSPLIAANPSAPSSGQSRRVSGGPARPSQDLSHLAPREDKGKSPAND